MRWKVHSWLCFGREFRCFGVKDWFLRSSFDYWRGGRGRRWVVCSWYVLYRGFEGWMGLAKQLIGVTRVISMYGIQVGWS